MGYDPFYLLHDRRFQHLNPYYRAQFEPDIFDSAAEFAGEALPVEAVYDSYRLGKDLFNRKSVDKSQYDVWKPTEMIGQKRRRFAGGAHVAGENNHPRNNVIGRGVVSIGDYPKLLRGRKTKYHHGGRNSMKKHLFSNYVSRFQSVNNYENANRSLLLVKEPSDEALKLPMYCYNLSGLCHNRKFNADVNFDRYDKIPLYRLQKDGVLAPGTQQYTWVSVPGTNDNMDRDLSRTICENRTDPPGFIHYYKNVWNNIQMLVGCSQLCDCRIHIAIVKFRRNVGPRRAYWDVDSNSAVNFDPLLDVSSFERNKIDGTWESFWAHRIVHPLSSYTPDNKTSLFTVLKSDTIICNRDNIQPTGIGPYQVLKKYFVTDGRCLNAMTGSQSDDTVATTAFTDPSSKQGPVGSGTVAAKPGGYNKIYGNTDCILYDNYEKDMWLLVWADMLPTGTPGAGGAICSFDLKVRQKFEFVRGDPDTA